MNTTILAALTCISLGSGITVCDSDTLDAYRPPTTAIPDTRLRPRILCQILEDSSIVCEEVS